MEPNGATRLEPIAPDSAKSKRKAAIEIAVAYLLILAVIWAPRPAQRYLSIAAVAGIVVILWRSFDGWKAMGFSTANLVQALWIVAAALGLAASAILVALRIHTLLLPAGAIGFVEGYLAYAVWTGVQQFLLQGFFLLRLLRVAPKGWVAALAAAVLFAAAHLPNPILTPITLVWGYVACRLFLRYRNVYPLMIAHAILGITVAMTVPGPVDHNMRVGLGYLTYNRWAHRHGSHRFSGPKPSVPGSAQP